jgi:Cu/Ag efflux pump CusA
MYFLGYNYSTATLVGIMALMGLATQTGIVMVLHILTTLTNVANGRD